MKTYNELQSETLSFSARKAKGRAMKLMNKKASTKKKKERNLMKAMSQDQAKEKAQKAARKIIMQKVAGKGKNLADLSPAQKEKLEKKTDDRTKKMGAAYQGLVKKMAKKVKKAHNLKTKELKAKKQSDNTGA
jgi:hypothetical protein